MNPAPVVAGQVDWGIKNLAYNIDFIPEDKFDWKPAPDANSAAEVVVHLNASLLHMAKELAAASSGDAPQVEAAGDWKPANRDDAKKVLLASAATCVAAIDSVRDEDLSKTVDLGFGVFPMSFVMGVAAIEALHHHGQISYIQELLGDTQSHFDMSLFG